MPSPVCARPAGPAAAVSVPPRFWEVAAAPVPWTVTPPVDPVLVPVVVGGVLVVVGGVVVVGGGVVVVGGGVLVVEGGVVVPPVNRLPSHIRLACQFLHRHLPEPRHTVECLLVIRAQLAGHAAHDLTRHRAVVVAGGGLTLKDVAIGISAT